MNLESVLLKRLKPHADLRRALHDIDYLRSSIPSLGCFMPLLRQTAKQVWGDLAQDHSHKQIRSLVHSLWKQTQTHDVMTICLLYFAQRKPENDQSDWRVLKTWANRIDNWAHSDMLSDLYADLLDRTSKYSSSHFDRREKSIPYTNGSLFSGYEIRGRIVEMENTLYNTFVRWNTDPHPWKRRLSLTSLLYYSSKRLHPLPASKILPLVKSRLHDDHFYVQRAVGWTLRECGNVYPKETRAFIQTHVRDLSSIAFTTATEKWNKTAKERLKRLRKRR